jgi:chemotaxis protein CheX
MDIERDDLVRAVGEVWETALGLPATPHDAPPAEPGPRVAAGVSIGGARQAEVVLACDTALARRAAATLFAVPEGEVTDDMILDTVGELANMTGGQLKALLPEGCTLSPPNTRTAAAADRAEGGVGFQAADGAFTVAVTTGDS